MSECRSVAAISHKVRDLNLGPFEVAMKESVLFTFELNADANEFVFVFFPTT